MAFDKKDKALLAASSLVGYCQSAGNLGEATSEVLSNWIAGLLRHTVAAANAIDAAIDEPTNRPGGE